MDDHSTSHDLNYKLSLNIPQILIQSQKNVATSPLEACTTNRRGWPKAGEAF